MATAPAVPASVLASAAPVVTVSHARALHVAVPEGADTGSAPATGEPYYWEDPSLGTDPSGVPVTTVVTHNLHWFSMQLLGGVEYVGEVFSEFLGLFNSRYEWALEAERQRQAEAEEEEQRTAQAERWAMIQRMNTQSRGAASTGGAASAPSSAVPETQAEGAEAQAAGVAASEQPSSEGV